MNEVLENMAIFFDKGDVGGATAECFQTVRSRTSKSGGDAETDVVAPMFDVFDRFVWLFSL